MNLAMLLSKHRTSQYDCKHFARDAWLEITGEDLQNRLPHLFGTGILTKSDLRALRPVPLPIDPCIVVGTQRGSDPHIGIFWNKSIIHLGPHIPFLMQLSQFKIHYNPIRMYV